MFTFGVTIFSSFLQLFVELVQEMEIDDLSDLGEEGEEEDEEPWYSDMSLKYKSLILSDQLGNRPHTNWQIYDFCRQYNITATSLLF